jgi:hypothetical protein
VTKVIPEIPVQQARIVLFLVQLDHRVSKAIRATLVLRDQRVRQEQTVLFLDQRVQLEQRAQREIRAIRATLATLAQREQTVLFLAQLVQRDLRVLLGRQVRRVRRVQQDHRVHREIPPLKH